MDNLDYLLGLGWGSWSTPYSWERQIKSVQALDIVNQIVEMISCGRKTLPVERPKVIVVGEQGSGKTSVLESLIGSGFLPKDISSAGIERGHAAYLVEVENKLKTTCPVVINLVKCASVKGCRHTFWVEFAHHDDFTTRKKEFVDLNEIQKEIEDRMVFLSANKSSEGVSEEELILTYFSSEVVNMTLIDLPGLTFSPADSAEGPSKLESTIEGLVLKYMSQPDTLILAVTQATYAQYPSSSILDFVKKVDPNEKRTLAVLSHWDKLPSTWQGHRIVLGQNHFKMEFGVVGIRNRSATDVSKKITVQNSQVEAEYQNMDHYKELTSVLTGVGVGPRYLVERVCEMIIYLWVSRLRAKKSTMDMVLDYMKHRITKREELIEQGYPDDRGCLAEIIQHLKYVADIIEKDWKDFGVEGSVSRHRELYEQFRRLP